jgi:hypothetical protein
LSINDLEKQILKEINLSGKNLLKLDEQKKEKFKNIINKLIQNQIIITMRGTNRKLLLEALSKKGEQTDENKLMELFFYYGDKAKSYYKENSELVENGWANKIEDTSSEFISLIFDKIKSLLSDDKRAKMLKFKEKAVAFVKYFTNESNKKHFMANVTDNSYLRDYYLYFLHISGEESEKSFFVSTTLSYNKALEFAGNRNENKYIIYYVLPKNPELFSNSHIFVKSDDKITQVCKKLPIYSGVTVYPKQKEISIKGCLFSENILGLKIITKNGKESFVPNPYLFTSENENEESIIEGLEIDKREIFEKSKKETNFINCVKNDYSENNSAYTTISQ